MSMTERRPDKLARPYFPLSSDIPFTHALPPGMSAEYFLRTRGAPQLRAGMASSPEQTFTAAQGRDIVTAAEGIHEYIRDNNIQNVVLLDRNARPTEVALRTVWHHENPGQDRPYTTYFLNTRGFLTEDDLAAQSQASEKGRAGKEFRTAVMSGDYIQQSPAGRTREEIQRDLKTTTPYLFSAREEPTLVFDTCIHEGTSVGAVLRELDSSGFTDLRFGVAGDSTNSSDIQPDFVALPDSDEMTCGLFGTDRMTVKPFTRVVAHVNPDKTERSVSRRMRENLRETIIVTSRSTQEQTNLDEPEVGITAGQSIQDQEARQEIVASRVQRIKKKK